ncbi:MAG TPA: hypothetical protein ENJ49_00285 [Candidatus Moranbacteria bacterium]|nr:hypothetical protein [Candidatus Moranbacteria bacterium]
MSDEKKVSARSAGNFESDKNRENPLKEEGIIANDNEKKKKENETPAMEKETVTEKVAEKESDYQAIVSKIKKKVTKGDDNYGVTSDAQKISQQTDAESQIQTLVDLAINKGVVHAVKVAKHLDNNYVLDKLHDNLLTDKLHKILKEKGMI